MWEAASLYLPFVAIGFVFLHTTRLHRVGPLLALPPLAPLLDSTVGGNASAGGIDGSGGARVAAWFTRGGATRAPGGEPKASSNMSKQG